MEDKKLVLDVVIRENYWTGCSEEINNDKHNIHFEVRDLSECPEDAIIGRDLFTAGDYIAALKKGMELAKLGYTSIVENIIEESDEEDE